MICHNHPQPSTTTLNPPHGHMECATNLSCFKTDSRVETTSTGQSLSRSRSSKKICNIKHIHMIDRCYLYSEHTRGFWQVKKYEISLEVGGWVQVSLGKKRTGKSSQNSHTLVQRFWMWECRSHRRWRADQLGVWGRCKLPAGYVAEYRIKKCVSKWRKNITYKLKEMFDQLIPRCRIPRTILGIQTIFLKCVSLTRNAWDLIGLHVPCVFCLYTLLKVVGHYDLIVLAMSVRGFEKKKFGWRGGVSCQVFLGGFF